MKQIYIIIALVMGLMTSCQEDKKKAQDWFKGHQKTLAANSPYDGIAKGKNIIMIQLEAFNNFFINIKFSIIT